MYEEIVAFLVHELWFLGCPGFSDLAIGGGRVSHIWARSSVGLCSRVPGVHGYAARGSKAPCPDSFRTTSETLVNRCFSCVFVSILARKPDSVSCADDLLRSPISHAI